MVATYKIERHRHGWLICSASFGEGIPMDALSECKSLFPKKSILDISIAGHFSRSGKCPAVMCVTTSLGSAVWRQEIAESIKNLPPQERWLLGLSVGTSSASIFAALCDDDLKFAAKAIGRGEIPLDADDFGRCSNLLSEIPEWRGSLHKVVEAYPLTKWREIVQRWDELEASEPDRQSEILNDIRGIHPEKTCRQAPSP